MRRGVIPGLCVLAALLCGIGATQLLGSRPRAGLVQQLAHMELERPFAARLSIPTRYRACVPPAAGTGGAIARETCGTSDADTLDLPALASGGQSSDPDSLQASALAAVIWWDDEEQSLNAAIDHLNRALWLSGSRVSLLVDLSAAHLVRAERGQDSYDLFAALERAREALAVEPRNEAAQFNAALAMQAIGLDEEATLAWDAYLAIDSTSEWADEARRRKDGLITRSPQIRRPVPGASRPQIDAFVDGWPQEAREYGMHDVLAGWGTALQNGDAARAALLLGLAEDLGGALEARPGGDASLAHAVLAIRRAASDRTATTRLARAHQAYALVHARFEEVKPKEVSKLLGRVVPARPYSPVLLQWTALYQAGTRYYSGEGDAAKKDLRELLAIVDSTRYPALKGRATLMLGTMLLRNSATGSREQAASAIEHFDRAGETEYAGAALSRHGEAAYQESDIPGAYQSLHRAQRALRPFRSSVELHKNLHAMAYCAVLDGMPHAALAILNEDLRVARREGTPARVIDVLQARAGARTIIGDSLGAARDRESMLALHPQLPRDEEVHQDWARAVILFSERKRVTAAQMDSVVESFSRNVIWWVQAVLRRADLRIEKRDLSGAIEDLERVTEGVRGLSLRHEDVLLRGATLEQARSRFDRLVMLYLQLGRPVDALRALERGRLSFAPPGDGAASPGGARLVAPAGHVALDYALIGDTLLTWTIRGDIIRDHRRTVNRREFLLTVEQVNAALESLAHAPAAGPGLQRLYDWLIRPVRGDLGARDTPLVIVADGEIAGVPFAALLDSTNDRYLVRDHPVRYAATLADAARTETRRARSGHALLVADPAFDPIRYPRLRPLENAREEAQAVRALYPSNLLLSGDSATRESFVQSLRGASVVHYAGHAVFDDTRPERSYLVLAGAETGRLTADSVSKMRLDGVRLVVLSACSTLRSREGRSGGFAGFSGALLGAGAGGVVGSLWQVSDELTRPLMEAFHQELRSHDPARALRQAQLRMLDARDDPRLNSPAAWAGFRYTGAERP